MLQVVLLGGLLAAVLVAGPATADGEWQMRHEQGELKVESRPYATSSIEEFRGQTTVNATLPAVIALLRDAPNNRNWVYRSGGARILASEGLARTWVYGVVDAPAPMQDRDTIVRFDLAQDPVSRVVTIDIVNQPLYLPEEPGRVRVPDFGGFWRLEPIGNSDIRVTYQVYGDPGGWVPVWLANYAALRSVVGTLEAMPAALKRYENSEVPGIQR